MPNKFGIPDDILSEMRQRDVACAYCRKMMVFPYSRANVADSATIEHLREAGPFHWKDGLVKEDIVICCSACNSSRGQKTHAEWFRCGYCIEHGITANTVAPAIRDYLLRIAVGHPDR